LTRARSFCMEIAVLAIAFSPAARAAQSGSATLTAQPSLNLALNLDTGAVSATGGDILWNGTALTPQGRAALYNLGKFGPRVFKSIRARSAAAPAYSSAPIPASKLTAGDIFGVHTNGGNYAKVIVTAAESGALSLQYTTFSHTSFVEGNGSIASRPAARPAAFGPPPFITEIQNNYSFLLPGVPNYGIAPGSIIVVEGQNLNGNQTPVLQSSAAPGLPSTLNQTNLSVTVNGVTTTPALYYASDLAVAAVLPSGTPVGMGTLTLTYNGNSTMAAIQVVPSAIGLDTLYGTGAGSGVVTDSNFKVLDLTNSALPGEPITLWASGLGADTSNDDRTYPQVPNNLTNIPIEVYIGGISANVLYRGRSPYPGLDQINVVVPANVTPGCFVSVVAETGSIVSNTVTVPVNPKGGACSDPALGLSGAQLQSLANKGSAPVNTLAVVVSEYTSSNGTENDLALVLSTSMLSAQFGGGNFYASQGSCSVFQPGTRFPFQAPLETGTIQLNGPAGMLDLPSQGGGYNEAPLPSGSLTKFPGTYTFTGSAGKDVGSFQIAIDVQTPFALINQAALTSIIRSQGATLSWSGGFANGDVMVNGVGISPNGSINFYCHAPSKAGQLTIPPSTLLALAPAGGKLIVMNSTAPQSVTATGIDLGLATGVVSIEVPTNFK
jgi:uncharacterized protein (TIGR03437 family)